MKINSIKLYDNVMGNSYERDRKELLQAFFGWQLYFLVSLVIFSIFSISIYMDFEYKYNISFYIIMPLVISLFLTFFIVIIQYLSTKIYINRYSEFWKNTLFVFLHKKITQEQVVDYKVQYEFTNVFVSILNKMIQSVDGLNFIREDKYVLQRRNDKKRFIKSKFYIQLDKDILQDVYIHGKYYVVNLESLGNGKYSLYNTGNYDTNNYRLKELMLSDEEELFIIAQSKEYKLPQEIRDIFKED